jgi:hypothetical protein
LTGGAPAPAKNGSLAGFNLGAECRTREISEVR